MPLACAAVRSLSPAAEQSNLGSTSPAITHRLTIAIFAARIDADYSGSIARLECAQAPADITSSAPARNAVVELTRGSGVTQGAVSQHLKSLKQAGLVVERPEGRRVYYRVPAEGPAPLVNWMKHCGG